MIRYHFICFRIFQIDLSISLTAKVKCPNYSRYVCRKITHFFGMKQPTILVVFQLVKFTQLLGFNTTTIELVS